MILFITSLAQLLILNFELLEIHLIADLSCIFFLERKRERGKASFLEHQYKFASIILLLYLLQLILKFSSFYLE